jgi:putative hemolysin
MLSKRKSLVLCLVIACLISFACRQIARPTQISQPTTQATLGMANPASKYCIDQGGKLDIRKDSQGGEYGVCIFPDGSQCDEWAFFRNECRPGIATSIHESTPVVTPGPSGVKLFENDQITFSYPQEWKLFTGSLAEIKPMPDTDLGAVFIAGVGDPEDQVRNVYLTSVFFMMKDIPSGSSLKEVYNKTYQNMPNIFPVNLKVITLILNGLQSIDRTYRVFWGEPAYELRDIWMEANGKAYILACRTEWMNPDHFANTQADCQTIIQSFTIR